MSEYNPPLPVPRSPRFRSLDLARGIACLMVVILHASLYSGYDQESPTSTALTTRSARVILRVVSRFGVGVPMFFVISGYCIAGTADSTRRKGGGAIEYFMRRFRRIFPPYWIVLALTGVLVVLISAVGWSELMFDTDSVDTGVIPHPSVLTSAQWLGNLSLTEHWRHHLFGGPELKLLGPSWTLCYEEQFYFICGIIIALAPRRFFSGIAVVTAITLAVMTLPYWYPAVALEGFFFDGRWLLFASGVLVYYHINHATRNSRAWIVVSFVLIVFGVSVFRYGYLSIAGTQASRADVRILGRCQFRFGALADPSVGSVHFGIYAAPSARLVRENVLQPLSRSLAGYETTRCFTTPSWALRLLVDAAGSDSGFTRHVDCRVLDVLPLGRAEIPQRVDFDAPGPGVSDRPARLGGVINERLGSTGRRPCRYPSRSTTEQIQTTEILG